MLQNLLSGMDYKMLASPPQHPFVRTTISPGKFVRDLTHLSKLIMQLVHMNKLREY